MGMKDEERCWNEVLLKKDFRHEATRGGMEYQPGEQIFAWGVERSEEEERRWNECVPPGRDEEEEESLSTC